MSSAEQALEAALLTALAASEAVKAILGDPVRVAREAGDRPALPYLEIARHVSEPANATGAEASEHRLDIAVPSVRLGGEEGMAAVAAIRDALRSAELAMEGWRCVLIVPVFSDSLATGPGRWRAVLRLKAVVEAA